MTTQQMARPNSAQAAMRREGGTLTDLVKANKGALQQIAAENVDLSRLYRIIIGAMEKTPALQKCSLSSILRSMMDAAEVGLEPNTPLGLAYLIPYKDDCTYMISYLGMIELARRSGRIYDIEAHAVYEGDVFEYEQGLTPKLRHVPGFGDRSAKKLSHVYAIARFSDGNSKSDVMTRADVDAIRGRSKASGSGPWATDYAEMAKKSVVRRICKLLPRSVAMERAFGQEVRAEAHLNSLSTMPLIGNSEIDNPFDTDFTDIEEVASTTAPVRSSAPRPLTDAQKREAADAIEIDLIRRLGEEAKRTWQVAGLMWEEEILSRIFDREVKDFAAEWPTWSSRDFVRLVLYAINQGEIIPLTTDTPDAEGVLQRAALFAAAE